jgi:hypothetical protein
MASLFVAIAGSVAVLALLTRVGADAEWLAALGRDIVAYHHVPAGIPFAAAPSAHWPNPLVLAELVFYALQHGLGDRGIMIAQLLSVSAALVVGARDALAEGAAAEDVARIVPLVAVGGVSSFAIARVQLFSLALFPVLVALLRSETRRPSRRIWLVVPLLAIWANLHGAVLVGLLATLAYLGLSRVTVDRPTALCTAAASVAGLFLTPAFSHTADYFRGVVTNVAAQRGSGLWARVSLASPLDDVALIALALLLRLAWKARPRRWEWASLAGVALAGAGASRSLVWLLLLLMAPAARAVRAPSREWGRLLPLVCAVAALLTGYAIVRGPASSAASDPLLSRAVAEAHGTAILAEDILAERIALRGGRIWMGNPLDAFPRRYQTSYLDWSEGKGTGLSALAAGVRIVATARGSRAAALMARAGSFEVLAGDRGVMLFARRRRARPRRLRTRSIRAGRPPAAAAR